MKILMLITGGIAAHKTPSIASALSNYGGHDIHVITTQNALKFVTKDALMYSVKRWWNDEYMAHIKIFEEDKEKFTKLVVVPATANMIGKIAGGIADDEVSTTCIKCPQNITKIIFPAMNNDMWTNKVIQRNLNILLDDGWCVVDPGYGKMACGAVGQGILPDTRDVVKCIDGIEFQSLFQLKYMLTDNNVWYYKYAGERFRLINGSWNDDYYYANPHVNDDRLSLGDGSSYPFDKNDGCIIPLTDLNRIKDYRFDIGKGYIHI